MKKPKRLFRNRPSPPRGPGVGAKAASKLGGCILCGRPSARVGTWTPLPRYARKLGFTPGKVGIVFYGLCAEHVNPANIPAIEDALLAEAYADTAHAALREAMGEEDAS